MNMVIWPILNCILPQVSLSEFIVGLEFRKSKLRTIVQTILLSLLFLVVHANNANAITIEQVSNHKIDSLQSIYKTTQNDDAKVILELELANQFEKINLTKSISYLLTAANRANKLKNDTLYAYINFNLGNYFFKSGSYNQALNSYKKYYDYYYSEKDGEHLLYVLPNLGAVCDMIEEYDQSILYYRQSEILYNKVKEKIGENRYLYGMVVVKNNIGNIYNEQKKYTLAISIYKQGLNIAEQLNNLDAIGNLCRNLGNTYININKPDSAFAYLTRSYNTKKSIKDFMALANTCISLAHYYILINNQKLCIKMLNEGKMYASKTNSIGALSNIEFDFYQLYKKNGDYKQALNAFEHYKTLNDSINSIDNMKKMVRTQTMLEVEGIQKQTEFNQKQREMRYIISTILSIALTIILILLYKVLKDKYRKLDLQKKASDLERQNLEQAVEIKNRELASNVLYLVQKNELISSIIKKLYDLKVNLRGENADITNHILSELKMGMNTGNWEEFEMRFQNVNSDFYNKLAEKYPELTPNERRLGALLRLNMSTKEILAITGQNARSIEMARHRLRKKLNIDNTNTNLVNFFMEI